MTLSRAHFFRSGCIDMRQHLKAPRGAAEAENRSLDEFSTHLFKKPKRLGHIWAIGYPVNGHARDQPPRAAAPLEMGHENFRVPGA